jgi:diguanylate cyclase (GGDEF)-like protein
MKPQPIQSPPPVAESAKSIAKVLEQSEHIEELVKESAEELATVNAALKQEISGRDALPGVRQALEKSEAVETKVEDASEKLTAVNEALEGEVRDRHLLDHRLAAMTEQEEAARHAAFHDVLTGLPNRALFHDRLEHGIAQAKRHGWGLAVMFLDLDRFKSINDTHGHDVGDLVLTTVAQRLKDNTRGDDTVSRIGGDEFLYLVMEVRDRKTVSPIAEKIINAIKAPLQVRLRNLDLTLLIETSIGIAVYPKHGASVDTLVKSADLAMYRAKQSAAGYAFAV